MPEAKQADTSHLFVFSSWQEDQRKGPSLDM